MTQNTNTVEGTDSGAQFVTDFNAILSNERTSNKGSSRPSYAVAGMLWIDDTNDPSWDVHFFDGTDDIKVGTIDSTANTFTPEGLPPEIITTRGDVIIGNSSGNESRLPIGANLTVLSSDGTDVIWRDIFASPVAPELKSYSETVVNLASSSSLICNLNDGNVFTATLNQSTTFTFSNPPASGKNGGFKLFLTQGSSAHSITWPTAVDWPGAEPPDLSTANAVYVLVFETTNGGSKWFGFLSGAEMG